jgi:hypothetical protein
MVPIVRTVTVVQDAKHAWLKRSATLVCQASSIRIKNAANLVQKTFSEIP